MTRFPRHDSKYHLRSKHLQDALRKDIETLARKLNTARTNLQQAVDAAEDNSKIIMNFNGTTEFSRTTM